MTYLTQRILQTSILRSPFLRLAAIGLALIALQAAPAQAQWTTNGNNINNTNIGNVGIGTTVPDAPLSVNLNPTTPPIPQAGTVMHFTGANASNAPFVLDSFGGNGVFIFRRANNTNASPQALPANTPIGLIAARGYDGSAYTPNNQAQISLRTSETWTPSTLGTHIFFSTTANGSTTLFERMRISDAGNVGIGTSTPAAKLDVVGTIRGGNADTNIGNHPSYGSAYGAFWRQGADYSLLTDGSNTYLNAPIGTGNVHFRSANADKMFLQGSTGNVGIGTTSPNYKLDVAGNINSSGTITGNNIIAKYQDVAEWVPASHALPAGTVVTLDPTKSNHVEASSKAYDTRVAGVISAQPGIALGERGDNKVLVATTGRVRLKVDTSNGPIQVGDLLVTSDVPGVAMKSEPIKLGGRLMHMPGTLIGKALEPLATGQGRILVLLSLQ